jgi:hypothetical protein
MLRRNSFDMTVNSICPNISLCSPDDKLIWLCNEENVDILVQICELMNESNI